ncbi:MAG: nicotinamide-nucleotide amidohydrolase family protein [Simkaniaceae bacterium]|nr:nicotinamide-nucleotide amidohydrolase family protein [Simkaniaceae bacterium]
MNMEIVSIGDELLTGRTVNGNGAMIAKALVREGYEVRGITTVGDDAGDIEEAVARGMARSPVVIATGGLGPTKDDLTRPAVAGLLGRSVVRSDPWRAELQQRYGILSDILNDQAHVIEGSVLLPNRSGTAPGELLTRDEKVVALLPGVPSQMEEILEKALLPELRRRISGKRIFRALFFVLLSENAIDPVLRTSQETYPEVRTGISPGYGSVATYLSAEKGSEERLNRVANTLREAFASYLYSESHPGIENALQALLMRKGLTLAVAESCTGGRIAARCTRMPGSSRVFLGSLVTYSDALKRRVLSVDPECLVEEGAVSEMTVRLMAEGVFGLSEADCVLATSGIAGPAGATEDKAVGTVCVAVGVPDRTIFTTTFSYPEPLGREVIMEKAGTELLAELWRYLRFGIFPFVDR